MLPKSRLLCPSSRPSRMRLLRSRSISLSICVEQVHITVSSVQATTRSERRPNVISKDPTYCHTCLNTYCMRTLFLRILLELPFFFSDYVRTTPPLSVICSLRLLIAVVSGHLVFHRNMTIMLFSPVPKRASPPNGLCRWIIRV